MLSDELSISQFVKHSLIGGGGAKLGIVLVRLIKSVQGGCWSRGILLGYDGQSLGCGRCCNQLAKISTLHDCPDFQLMRLYLPRQRRGGILVHESFTVRLTVNSLVSLL
jgi:hypothetical protein